MSIKQVIVIRKDLRMRRGKEIAQGSHASMKFLSDKLRSSASPGQNLDKLAVSLSPAEQAWIFGSFAKVTLQVSSEAELLEVHQRALNAGLTSCLIQDAGVTEFGGIPTYTCLAIGPDHAEKIDPITGNLSLY